MVISEMSSMYLREQRINKYSKSTYYSAFNSFAKWIVKNKLEFNSLARHHIVRYVDYLEDKHELSTARYYYSIIRGFYAWMHDNGYFGDICKGIRAIKVDDNIKRNPLTVSQVEKMYNVLNVDTPLNLRNTLMIELMLKYGLRRVEVHRLNIGDIRNENDEFYMYIQGKGKIKKNDKLKLTNVTSELIGVHIENLKYVSDNSPLFVSFGNRNKNNRISKDSISNVVSVVFRDLGLGDKYTAHSLRHTHAMLLITELGLTVEQVQGRLRHKSITTTQRYFIYLKKQMILDNAAVRGLDERFKIRLENSQKHIKK
jgi:site-specific recombinase XerD